MERAVYKFFFSLLLILPSLQSSLAQTVLEGKGRFVENNPVTIRVWTNSEHIKSPPRAIVLEIPALNVAPLKKEGSVTSLADSSGVLARMIDSAAPQGIAHALLDLPSDAVTLPMPVTWRENYNHHKDIDVGIELLRQRFPGTKIYLGAYATNALSLLTYADRSGNKSDGLVMLSPNLSSARLYKLSQSTRGLVISVPTARCYSSSFVDAQELVKRTNWTLLPVYYNTWGNRNICGNTSQAGLVGRFKDVGLETAQWLLDQSHAASLGDDKAGPAGAEEIRLMNGSKGLVEVTLFKPAGAGPFPMLIWNHGDVELGSLSLKGARYREPLMAHEFVDMGLAVAVVSRPGVGKSEGTYARSFNPGDADATYKGRIHAKELLAVWPQLQELPWVNKQQLIIAGQSAGGFASVAAANMQIPELKAALTFSGGRTDMTSTSPATHRNEVMIRGFAESGKGANAPLMMIFAENDSRYTANTIRESYKAFVDAGGKATLALYPPRAVDGHFVYHEPNLWREEVRKFLMDAGLKINPNK
jgi:dienelactone hydrolase